MTKDLKHIVRLAEAAGWRVRVLKSGHVQFIPVDPSAPLVVSSGSPSDHRSMKNLLVQLRRAGLVV